MSTSSWSKREFIVQRSIEKINTELVDGDYNYDRGVNISVNLIDLLKNLKILKYFTIKDFNHALTFAD